MDLSKLDDDPSIERIAVPAGTEASYAMRINDDSMTRADRTSFPEGTLLLFDATRQHQAGDFVMAEHPETFEPIFRRLVDHGDFWLLKPLNSRYAANMVQAESLKVFGVLVRSIAMLDF